MVVVALLTVLPRCAFRTSAEIKFQPARKHVGNPTLYLHAVVQVRESMLFSALLRLPPTVSIAEKKERAQSVINDMVGT